MITLRIAFASLLAIGALLAGATQAQQPASAHAVAMAASPNGQEQCCM
jgi:hypothetical protein